MTGAPYQLLAVNDAVVLVVVANPEPLHGVTFVQAKSTVVESDARRPQLANFFEVPQKDETGRP